MIGRTLGHYCILEPVGAGGMGVVYLARDQLLNRNVVLKLLPPGTDSDQAARRRLVREAQTASALNHPYICTVHEVGEEAGQVFIAMEHVEGETLAALVARGPMPLQQVMRYGCQIAEALEHAHAKRVVHHDLKSGNVMITSEGRVKVLDFGLAKRLPTEDGSTLSRSLTGEGRIAGTLQYMAPEVLRGAAGDERADIWALGVMLYEMNTARTPFAGNSTYELTTAILRDEPPPLPEVVPGPVARVIGRCLTKQPSQRYQRAAEVRAALEALQPGAAVAVPHAEPVRQPRRRRWLWTAAAFLVVAFALAATAYWLGMVGQPIRSIAVLPFDGSGPDTDYLSDGITDSLIDSISRVADIKVISHTSVFHYKGKEIDPQAVGHKLNVGAVLTGRVVRQGDSLSVSLELIDTRDNTRLWGEQHTRKLSEVAALQRDISEQVRSQLRLHLSREQKRRLSKQPTENSEAYQLFLRGRYYWYKGTPEAYEKSREYYQQAIDKDPTYALAYAGLAGYYIQLADDGLAAPGEVFPKAKALDRKALELDPNLGFAHNGLAGVALLYDWNFLEAEREFKRAMELTPNWVETHRSYAIYRRVMGRLDEAIISLKRARDLDPLSISINTSLGWNYYYARRYPEAIEQFRTSIAMDPSSLSAQFGLVNAYQKSGMDKEGFEALQSYVTAIGDADLAAQLGHQFGFRAAMRRFWQIALEFNTKAAKHTYKSPMVFASLYAELGDKDEAFAWLERAYQDRSSKLLDLKIDPDFDGLRQDPRYKDLVQRVGLP